MTNRSGVTVMAGMSNDEVAEVPRVVRPGEAAALVAAYAQAEQAEKAVRWLLTGAGIPASVAAPVAGLDEDGRPVVRVVLYTTEQAHLFRIIAAIRSDAGSLLLMTAGRHTPSTRA